MDKSCYEMNAKMYYAQDCDLSYLDGKTIAVIGYGSQGPRPRSEPARFRLQRRHRPAQGQELGQG